MIEICNLRNEKPKYDYDIKVCRGASILGNPYYLGCESRRDWVCNKYYEWLTAKIVAHEDQLNELDRLRKLYKKHGKLRLFCWCAPKRCHAETIKQLILQGD